MLSTTASVAQNSASSSKRRAASVDTNTHSAMDRLVVAISVLFVICGRTQARCNNVTAFQDQIDTLLAEYDRNTAPSVPLAVVFALHTRHVSLDEKAGTVKMLTDLKMKWKDPRVTWNEQDWGCDSVLISAERLWFPDVAVISSAVTYLADPMTALVTPTGDVVSVTRYHLSVPVEINLEDWPRDTQTAVVKFASRDHDVAEIELLVDRNKTSLAFESGAWSIVSLDLSAELFSMDDSARRACVMTVMVQRRAPAHSAAASAVLTVAVLLQLAAAFLLPEQRLPFYASASMAAALWLIAAMVRLPASYAAPRGVHAVAAVCGLGAAGAAAAAVANRVARLAAPPPAALRTLLSAASVLCDLTSPQGSSDGESGAWTAAARLLDRALLSLLTLALFVAVCIYL